MAGDNPRRGDRVLESRHLVGLFLGVVLLCCVFFTLGYVMGRTQYSGAVHASLTPAKEPIPSRTPTAQPKPAAPAPAPGEWDFYPSKKGGEPAASSVPLQPKQPAAEAKRAAAPSPPSKPPARFRPPQIPRGAIVLQLAAMSREGDALALADTLQQKKFSAFVITPTADNLYRVQVGPFADAQSAETAKRSLEREGFKVIVKH